MGKLPRPIPWLLEGEKFPCPDTAWTDTDPAPGLLAAGATLAIDVLLDAYSQGIFPWFSVGQPILWWSPNPRMVLQTWNFHLHRSLRKRLHRVSNGLDCEIRMDHTFEEVITACAHTGRAGQSGTWIGPEMVKAYLALHHAGHAHSVETWVDGKLMGGLYCINIGSMVFGESMFSRQSDASKIALAALVAFCRANQISMIDCQQNTRHLASLGALEITRELFAEHLARTIDHPAPLWNFKTVYWGQLLHERPPHSL